MSKYAGIIVMIVALFAEMLSGAGPIIWLNTKYVKRLNNSLEYPIELYMSTDANHRNKYFVARTIARLKDGALSKQDQKKVRNEICAGRFIINSNGATSDGWNFRSRPGSTAAYVKNGSSIVAVSDIGLSGEKLGALLERVASLDAATKLAIASYYAVAMFYNLQQIHAVDVLWNNVDLNNFYARPDGGTYAADFTKARKSATPDKKNAEMNSLVSNTFLKMFQLLFPSGTSDEEYADFLARGAIQGIALAAPTQVAVKAAIDGGGVPDSGQAAAAAGFPPAVAAAISAATLGMADKGAAINAAVSAAKPHINEVSWTEVRIIAALQGALPGGKNNLALLQAGLGPNNIQLRSISNALGVANRPGVYNSPNAIEYLFTTAAKLSPYLSPAILPANSIAAGEQGGGFINIFALGPTPDAVLNLMPLPNAPATVDAFCNLWTGS